MACSISISTPTAEVGGPGQGIVSLTVSGTANECASVRVRVQQTQPVHHSTPEKTVPVSGGAWSAAFTVAADDFPPGTFLCGRGNKYVIEAVCDDDPECSRTLADSLISCGGCPDVTFTITPGDCEDGRRTVQLRAGVASSADATYVWFFGTDEDNQPGEDSQAGDGAGNLWLPPPGPDGLRVVETAHVYEPAGEQPANITVRLVTSTGPTSECAAEAQFTLEPCTCDLRIGLEVLDPDGTPVPAEDCVPPGDYTVRVTSPSGSGVTHAWSVNGVSVSGQSGAELTVGVTAGETRTVSVFVTRGGCSGSNAVFLAGCEDCSAFEAGVRVLDGGGNVPTGDCLQPGSYTVEVTAPTGAGNAFRWWIDDELQAGETGPVVSVEVPADTTRTVTLEARRGDCSDIATATLEACREPIVVREDDGFIPCLMFKLLALLGLGLVILGLILVLCPLVAAPFPVQVAIGIGTGLVLGGAVLLLLGLVLWVLICNPDRCDWLAFLWQSLILLGLAMVYAGLCPGCSWMLIGVLALIAGAWLAVVWGRGCNVSTCRVLAEWISLFTFVVNVVGVLEMILAACVITTRPVAAIMWGLMIAAIQAWLWWRANASDCIRR